MLTSDAAKSELMQFIHGFLLSLPVYALHRDSLLVSHIYGEANVAADAASRGEFVTLHALFAQLGLAPLLLHPPNWLPQLLDSLLELLHNSAQTEPGMSNPCMIGTPFAHLIFQTRRASSRSLSAIQSASSVRLSLPPAFRPLSKFHPTTTPQTVLAALNPYMLRSPFAHDSPCWRLSAQPLSDTLPKRVRTGFAPVLRTSLSASPPLPLEPPPPPAPRSMPLAPHRHPQPSLKRPPGSIRRLGARLTTHRLVVSVALCQMLTFTERPSSRRASCASCTFGDLLAHALAVRPPYQPAPIKRYVTIRRMHNDRHYPMVSSHLVTLQVCRLNREYAERVGIEDLVPRRKEPFTREILVDVILKAPDGFDVGVFLLDWASHRSGRSLCAPSRPRWLNPDSAKVRLLWSAPVSPARIAAFPGARYAGSFEAACILPRLPTMLSFALLRGIMPSSFPRPVNQTLSMWFGVAILYGCPFQPGEPLCAFSALADVEVRDPVPVSSDPSSIALFTRDDASPFSASQLSTILRRLLARCLPPPTVALYSWHSARIFLATMLLAAGVSRAEIQALCRWQSDESLRIYARLDAKKYASLLGRAMAAHVTTARARNLADALPS
ncbi:MAG: hypothetical protein SGPRY_010156 [Prymnesium sp.]